MSSNGGYAMPPMPDDKNNLELVEGQNLTEKADHQETLRHWKQFRPKLYQYLRSQGVLREAVKLATENRERTFSILTRKGVESREAAIHAREYHTKLPSEDRQPILEPAQAPLGQPEAPEDPAVPDATSELTPMTT